MERKLISDFVATLNVDPEHFKKLYLIEGMTDASNVDFVRTHYSPNKDARIEAELQKIKTVMPECSCYWFYHGRFYCTDQVPIIEAIAYVMKD